MEEQEFAGTRIMEAKSKTKIQLTRDVKNEKKMFHKYNNPKKKDQGNHGCTA